MSKESKKTGSSKTSPFKKATTPEARENQMISLAMDLAEQQLRDGTASSQVITHYLKLGSTKEKLEQQIMANQKEYLEAKTAAMQSAQRIEELYTEALDAMRGYAGQSQGDSDDPDLQ